MLSNWTRVVTNRAECQGRPQGSTWPTLPDAPLVRRRRDIAEHVRRSTLRQRQLIARVTKRLPNRPDAPGFYEELVLSLRESQISQSAVRSVNAKVQSQYTEIPYEVSAFGQFHKLGNFLTLIEQNPQRFMRIKNFVVTNIDDRPSVHPIEMEIATFMFNR